MRKHSTREWISDLLFFSSIELEGEVWLQFDSFRDKILSQTYEVSNKGRVRNAAKHILKGSITNDGYHEVSLSVKNSNNSLNVRVHRIVLTYFQECPENVDVLTVHHINHNKLDNRIENLCWMSAFVNNQEGHGQQVKLVDSFGEHIFESQKFASNYLGRYEDYVAECIRNGYAVTNSNNVEVETYLLQDNIWIKYNKNIPRNKHLCKLIRDNDEWIFKSFWECDRFLHKPEGYISNIVANKWPLEGNYALHIYDNDEGCYIEYVPGRNKIKPNSCRCKLISECGETQIFKSISDAARYINRDPEYVRLACKSNRNIKSLTGQIYQILLTD